MHQPISEPDLVTLLDEADAAAARLWRRARLPRADLDDLRQDLLADLIRRLPSYDARRGTMGAFAGLVLRNQASRIAMRIRRERRASGGHLLSLDTQAGDGRTLLDRLGDTSGLASWHGPCAAVEAVVDARINLKRAVGALHARELLLCAAVTRCPVRILAERGPGSRATLYRRLRDLRCALAAHGARAA
jgi:hypothetical protein